jgi:hypothetical protein
MEPVATLNIGMMQQSYNLPVPEGTYYVVDTDCWNGVTAYLTGSSQKKAVYIIEISSGLTPLAKGLPATSPAQWGRPFPPGDGPEQDCRYIILYDFSYITRMTPATL